MPLRLAWRLGRVPLPNKRPILTRPVVAGDPSAPGALFLEVGFTSP